MLFDQRAIKHVFDSLLGVLYSGGDYFSIALLRTIRESSGAEVCAEVCCFELRFGVSPLLIFAYRTTIIALLADVSSAEI